MKKLILAICMLATCSVTFGQGPTFYQKSEKLVSFFDVPIYLESQKSCSFAIDPIVKKTPSLATSHALTSSQRGSILYQMRSNGYTCVEGIYTDLENDCETVAMCCTSYISFYKEGGNEVWLAQFMQDQNDEKVNVTYCKYIR